MKRKTFISGAALVALALAGPTVLRAQAQIACDDGEPCSIDASQTVTATIDIPQVLYIDVTGDVAITFPGATAADFNTGFVNSVDATTITTRANVGYSVTATADQDFGNFRLGIGGFGTLVAMTGGADQLFTGGATANTTTTINYRYLLDYATAGPGTAATEITFTMVAD